MVEGGGWELWIRRRHPIFCARPDISNKAFLKIFAQKKYYLEIMEHVEENSKFLIGTEIRDKVCFLTKF